MPRSVGEMLDLGEAGQLAADGRQHVRALAARQELQPVALEPAEHRDRQLCAAPFGAVVERDAECSANAVSASRAPATGASRASMDTRCSSADSPDACGTARGSARTPTRRARGKLPSSRYRPSRCSLRPAMQVAELLPPLRLREECSPPLRSTKSRQACVISLFSTKRRVADKQRSRAVDRRAWRRAPELLVAVDVAHRPVVDVEARQRLRMREVHELRRGCDESMAMCVRLHVDQPGLDARAHFRPGHEEIVHAGCDGVAIQ